MEFPVSFDQKRRRRSAIAFFIAATFGLAAILSLPVARFIPFPFQRPAVPEALGPPEPLDLPFAEDGPSMLRPGNLARLRGGHVAGPLSQGSGPPDDGGSNRGGKEGREPLVGTEASQGITLSKEKVPGPGPNQPTVDESVIVEDSEPSSKEGKGDQDDPDSSP